MFYTRSRYGSGSDGAYNKFHFVLGIPSTLKIYDWIPFCYLAITRKWTGCLTTKTPGQSSGGRESEFPGKTSSVIDKIRSRFSKYPGFSDNVIILPNMPYTSSNDGDSHCLHIFVFVAFSYLNLYHSVQ